MADEWGIEGHGYFFAGIFWGILKVLLSLRNGGIILGELLGGVAILAMVAIIAMADTVGGDGDGADAMNRVPTKYFFCLMTFNSISGETNNNNKI